MNVSERKLILLVDDDRKLTDMLSELLEMEGYACITASSGARGLLMTEERKPDLLVLDVMMPGENGVETLRRMRKFSDVPVIMLTAMGEDGDRIRGLEAGADDYLAKPFVARELLLRIRAVLKRSTDEFRKSPSGERSAGPLRVQLDRQRAEVGETPLDLTATELRILFALLEKTGAVVSREHLSQYAIGRTLFPQDRSLDTHVSNLRRKISAAGDSSCAIRTVRGAGYRLTVD